MFTGIVEEVGTIRNIKRGQHSAVLTIQAKTVLEETRIGDSIAVNGICLTVTRLFPDGFSADVMHETLNRSSLAGLTAGSMVNLERAMPANGRFGGHIVAGHVDGVGHISNIRRDDTAVWYTVHAGPEILRYVVEKGSITIDGISLTVAAVDGEGFSVSTIPHNRMLADESKCVDCQRCVAYCPTHALKIEKNRCALRESANWSSDAVEEIWKQAATGGVLLSSMGSPKELPVYWDRLLLNASQVTNPPIDPLREPMETRVFLGKKPERIRRDAQGRLITELTPQLELSMPVLFSAMSYGSISFNAHESLARAAEALGICYNTGEGGLHEDLYRYGRNTITQVASGRFGVHEDYLMAGAAIEIKMGQGPSRASADTCRGRRS